jgi:hypothetical protein
VLGVPVPHKVHVRVVAVDEVATVRRAKAAHLTDSSSSSEELGIMPHLRRRAKEDMLQSPLTSCKVLCT